MRGSVLLDETRTHTAVTLEPAAVPELAPLVVHAYGLTERERLVTELVAQGLSTAAIARRLHLSPFTVQDHLKAIFDKLGVSSRGELVATLFVDHYLVDGSLSEPGPQRRPTRVLRWSRRLFDSTMCAAQRPWKVPTWANCSGTR